MPNIISVELFYLQVLTEGMKVIIMFKLFCRFYHLQTLFLFRLILLGSSEIMEKLVEEGVLSKTGKETYAINKDKVDFFLN